MQTGALSDIKVLDLTRVLSGPYAAMWLGDLGADIIKIEVPGRGDDARFTPMHVNGASTFFAAMNRNKRSITLNLKAPEGRDMFLEMVKQADVVMSNYRPGVMERLGLGYDVLSEINPRIIFATVSGFGQEGEYAQRPAYDIVAQGMGGIMSMNGVAGGGPTRVGASVADTGAGINMVVGILAALHARTLSGRGQCVDIALVDSVLAFMPSESMRHYVTGEVVPPLGNRYIGNSPYGAFRAKDKEFILACGSDKLFAQFCERVLKWPELAQDERFSVMVKRSDNHEQVKKLVEDWASQYTADQCVEIILDAGLPAGPIYNMADIHANDHIARQREMLLDMDQPGIGHLRVTNNPIRLSDTKSTLRMPAPLLGQHNREVYGQWLGLDEEQLEQLKEKGII